METNVDVNIDIIRQNVNGLDFKIGGKNKGNYIGVILLVFNDFSINSFDRLRDRLSNVIKHEVYHLKDVIDNKIMQEFNHNIDDPMGKIRTETQYMLSETEIMAYIVGIMVEAKKSGQKFEDVLRREINGNFYNSDMALREKLMSDPSTRAEIEDLENRVYNTMIEQAFKRYPLLKKRYNGDIVNE